MISDIIAQTYKEEDEKSIHISFVNYLMNTEDDE